MECKINNWITSYYIVLKIQYLVLVEIYEDMKELLNAFSRKVQPITIIKLAIIKI